MGTGVAYTVVVCFENSRRERFLVALHRSRGWELPGGRLEPGEDALACALREFREEIGRELVDARLLVRQEKANGTAWVFEGLLGPPVPDWRPHAEESIGEWRFVRRLSEVAPLAFPEDPYEEMERALGRPMR
ncbi:MAG TPA: NUDIX domain-containing protein [Candidatus Thermoplasmatota archaeon]|nr:NUDIX domain-containing protein [Candidatus Thermoplasmatota archaeon]